MRTVHKFSFLVPLLTFITLFYGCGGGGVVTVAFKEHELINSSEATQTKGDVTITLNPLKPSSMYDEPALFSFSQDKIAGNYSGFEISSYYPKDYQNNNWCYTFGLTGDVLVAYKVKIKNATTHILRMKDARIYLMVEGQDPIPAFNILGNTTLVQKTVGKEQILLPKSFVELDQSFVSWLTSEEENYERNRSKGILSVAYPIGIGSQVIAQNIRAYKFLTDVSREILPNTTFEGILLFPIRSSTLIDAKIMFYDITTKTDNAGNPVEKVSFEYPIKFVDQQMWFENEKERRWKVGVPTK
ncbi:MAG: hypothetical protein Q8N03_08365 [Ignavibacteria bacterium]|jgi:hypothetical protein|nr:hypothetical protein [Ignavibacteria bacterium]